MRARGVSPSPSLASTRSSKRLTEQSIEHEPVETYSNGVRHANVPDPDGNAIAFAECRRRRAQPPLGAILGIGASRTRTGDLRVR